MSKSNRSVSPILMVIFQMAAFLVMTTTVFSQSRFQVPDYWDLVGYRDVERSTLAMEYGSIQIDRFPSLARGNLLSEFNHRISMPLCLNQNWSCITLGIAFMGQADHLSPLLLATDNTQRYDSQADIKKWYDKWYVAAAAAAAYIAYKVITIEKDKGPLPLPPLP